jgi:hypothetical protein
MSAETIFVFGLMTLLVVGYFVLMIFFPEWVGMSGKKTKDIQKEHEDPGKPHE